MRLTSFIGLFIGSCVSRPGEVIVLKKSAVIYPPCGICASDDSVRLDELPAFSLLLNLENKILCHEAVNLAAKINGLNAALSIKKSGELNSEKLDSMGGVLSICFGGLGLVFAEEKVCILHDCLRSI